MWWAKSVAAWKIHKIYFLFDIFFFLQMRKALQDQQDVNTHLRKYIDSVLLNIMDKYPELLEVRSKWSDQTQRWLKESVELQTSHFCDKLSYNRYTLWIDPDRMCLCDSQEKYFWEVSENWPDTACFTPHQMFEC